MLQLASKLPGVGTTIFTTMSQLAHQYQAINLGQGFPDFTMHPQLIALCNKAMQEGHNQYAHMYGIMVLREQIAQKVHQLYHAAINPETQITITPGGTYALYTACTTLLQPGDEVIVFEPAYDSYLPNILVNGAKPIRIPLQYPHYQIPWSQVAAAITSKTKLIILNSPHNPTGSVLSSADIEALRQIVANTNIFILSDEVYEHLIYDELQHHSLLRYPDLLERSFVCFSFGKTYHCTGWKLGYCITSPQLMQAFRSIHQFNAFSCDTPKQLALAQYMQASTDYLELAPFFERKRNLLRKLMTNTPFVPLPSSGSYFECYSYAHFSNENDVALATRLTKEYGVTAIPVSAFYHNATDHKVLRFCFAKQDTTLIQAVERLTALK